MRRIPAAAVVAALLVAVPAGGAPKPPPPHPLLAYSNGIDLVLYDPVAHTRRTLVRGRPLTQSGDAPSLFAIEPAWSPDGSRIAYVRAGSSGFSSTTRLAVADVATAATRRISRKLGDAASGYGLRWSPDGRWIAHLVPGARELWVARADGSRDRLLARDRGLRGRMGSLGWTRVGRLVFRTHRGRFVASPDGGRPRSTSIRFPPPPRAPDGRRLAIVRDAGGDDQIAVVSAAGALLARLTADRPLPGRLHVRSCCPRWSPDGRWFAFEREGAVVVAAVDGSRERRVLEDAKLGPWSPDGRYLLVARSLAGGAVWLYEPATARLTLVAQSFAHTGWEYAPGGAAWRPGPTARFETVAPATRVAPRHVETPFPEGAFRRGRARIVDVEPLALAPRTGVSDVSPDGRLVALTTGLTRHSARVSVRDLATGAGREIGVAASPWWDDRPRFDLSGTRLLYRHWHELWAAPTAGGRPRLVARDAGAGPVTPLRGGGVAYLDVRGRLVVLPARGAVRRYRLALPRSLLDTLAIAPDGRRILYARSCDVWLADLPSARVRRLAHAAYSPLAASWSPAGDRIALGVSQWESCDGGFDWYHAETVLFDLRGRPLDLLPGHAVGWSADGRYLLTEGGVTGTEVGALQPLALDDVRARRQSLLLRAGAGSLAFVSRSGRLIFTRYDGFGPQPVYVGRLGR